jgi:hypothetical protein
MLPRPPPWRTSGQFGAAWQSGTEARTAGPDKEDKTEIRVTEGDGESWQIRGHLMPTETRNVQSITAQGETASASRRIRR